MQCSRAYARKEHTGAFWAKLRQSVADKDWNAESALFAATKAHILEAEAHTKLRFKGCGTAQGSQTARRRTTAAFAQYKSLLKQDPNAAQGTAAFAHHMHTVL